MRRSRRRRSNGPRRHAASASARSRRTPIPIRRLPAHRQHHRRPKPSRPGRSGRSRIHAPIKTWFWIVDEVGPPLPLKLSIEEIQTAVERHCNVRRAELISARRSTAIVRPRQIAMFLSRHLTLHSLPVIGRKFGNRDHTTVLHAVRRIEALRSHDQKVADDLDAISRALAAQVP